MNTYNTAVDVQISNKRSLFTVDGTFLEVAEQLFVFIFLLDENCGSLSCLAIIIVLGGLTYNLLTLLDF